MYDNSFNVIIYILFLGRPTNRRRSHKSSGSETSDEDSESRRASRTNLAGAFTALNRIRRDSSGDRDQGGGGSGGYQGKHRGNDSDVSPQAHEQDEGEESSQSRNNSGGTYEDESECFKENLLDNSKPHLNNNSSMKYTQKKYNENPVLNNMVHRGRRVAKHKAPSGQITNVFEKRSKSAESTSTNSIPRYTGSQTSSACSSCSSLTTHRKGRLLPKRVYKNSPSTMSDTGLVLRWNNLRRACVQEKVMPRSPSSSSFSSLFVCNGLNSLVHEGYSSLHRPHSEGNVRKPYLKFKKNVRQNSQTR